METTKTATPAIDAIQRAREEGSEIVGEFIEWLTTQDLAICSSNEWGIMERSPWSNEQILNRFFGIDPEAAERERRAILESLRAART